MKLASLKSTSRDGELIVVSRDLRHAVSAQKICPTLQQALEHWDDTEPALNKISTQLNDRAIKHAFNQFALAMTQTQV